VSNEIQLLQKELEAAQAEIQSLRLRLNNVTFILKEEMKASGTLPKLGLRDTTIPVAAP
jgi:prefoldin subunit 5